MFYLHEQPILSPKPDWTTLQNHQGLWLIHVQIRGKSIFQQFYTCVDKTMMIWAAVTATIFFTAQFSSINWTTMAIVSSILTGCASAIMWNQTWVWVTEETVRWLIYWWLGLMMGGIALTDVSIFYSWSQILIQLCPLWLALCGFGYLGTGWALQSRSFFLGAGLHFLGMAILPLFPQWQYLVTGFIISGTLLLFSERRWDMRP
ncbi:hypothetical protein NG799_15775 [Laspinema sp. D1]|uniref:DUF2157 domain-containing protein n=1 Tax=Laspinema palackyanum D2a TaxID=2953684 RepID=A0ABT2MV80_9CYAN|nr:hypothetical protein [Laspinema sp. D2a]